MSSDEDDIPDLVPAQISKVPITIITGFLGIFSHVSHSHLKQIFVPTSYLSSGSIKKSDYFLDHN